MKLRKFTHRFGSLSLLGLSLTVAAAPLSASATLNLGVSSSNYLGQGSESRQGSYSALDLRLDSMTQGDEIDSRAFVQAQIGFNDPDYRFIEFPELYMSTSKKWTGPARYTLGRKLVNWSDIDRNWGSGAFEPRFRWDYLRPEKVGLLGTFLEVEKGPVKFTAFLSPIYIPDRGAPLDFADGRIRSISPWVVNPPYSVEVLKKETPVRYEAKIPKVGDIIFQKSIGAQIAVGEKLGPWISQSYAYKPMNQLLMSYEGNLLLGPTGEVRATLYPRVAYHHLAATDLGFRGKQMDGSLSFLADIPKDEPQSTLLTSQQVGNFYLLSPTLRLRPFGPKSNGGEMSLSYLRVFGKDRVDQGKFSDGSSSEFDSRYPYKNAFLFSAQLPTWRRLTADLKMLLDFEHPGTIVSWYFNYAASKDWRLFLSTDVLSSYSKDDVVDGTDFIKRYRENDRVTGGVSYVF